MEKGALSRAQGCLLGQLAGDSLGSLVEFLSPDAILNLYPNGVRTLHDGGIWGTIAGQPTDDSEMALLLARMLLEKKEYSSQAAKERYRYWLDSAPFDCGNTIAAALSGTPTESSQANGALMRVSPLGIWGSHYSAEEVAAWAVADAMITHPNPICLQANALFAGAIAHAIATGIAAGALYGYIVESAKKAAVAPALEERIALAASDPPSDYLHQQGWVLTAFHNALYQLLYAPNLEEGVVDTVMRGGDTDTNAAICGALLGAVYGRKAIPKQWEQAILSCRPERGNPLIQRPRPQCMWPVDALEIAEQLIAPL